MLGIPGFQREKNLLQRLGKKKYQKINLDEAEGMCAFYNFRVF